MLEVELEEPITIPNQQTANMISKSPAIKKMSVLRNKKRGKRLTYLPRVPAVTSPLITKAIAVPIAATIRYGALFLRKSFHKLFDITSERKGELINDDGKRGSLEYRSVRKYASGSSGSLPTEGTPWENRNYIHYRICG
jgi:hypothetical protein